MTDRDLIQKLRDALGYILDDEGKLPRATTEAKKHILPAFDEANAKLAEPVAQVGELPTIPDGLIAALRGHFQIDEDGTNCGVSRQAVCEAADLLERFAAIAALRQPSTIDWIEWPYSDAWCDGLRASLVECGMDIAAQQINALKRFVQASRHEATPPRPIPSDAEPVAQAGELPAHRALGLMEDSHAYAEWYAKAALAQQQHQAGAQGAVAYMEVTECDIEKDGCDASIRYWGWAPGRPIPADEPGIKRYPLYLAQPALTVSEEAVERKLRYLHDDVLARALRNRLLGPEDIEEAQELVAECLESFARKAVRS